MDVERGRKENIVWGQELWSVHFNRRARGERRKGRRGEICFKI
jgi:hypothetical protein